MKLYQVGCYAMTNDELLQYIRERCSAQDVNIDTIFQLNKILSFGFKKPNIKPNIFSSYFRSVKLDTCYYMEWYMNCYNAPSDAEIEEMRQSLINCLIEEISNITDLKHFIAVIPSVVIVDFERVMKFRVHYLTS